MGIDIDSFLNKVEAKEEAMQSKKDETSQTTTESNKKVDLNFEKGVSENLKEIEANFKEKNLEQLKEIYDDLKKFDENIPSKFLNIQTIGSNTINSLSEQYSTKLLSTLESNAKIIHDEITKNNASIEEDLISKEYKVCIKLIKENKELLKQYPNEFSNKKHELKLLIRKYEIKINQEIRNFKINESQLIKKKVFEEVRKLKKHIESNHIENIEQSLQQIELMIQKIPSIFRAVFTEENIIIQKAIATGETKILEIENKKFNQKEKEIKIVQEKFQSSIIKKDLNSALLLYNEVLLLFEDLPNTNFKEKITYLNIISKLHSQLNTLYVKNNVELLLGGYNNSKVIEEARNYIDHIEITKKLSLENISLIYDKLKNLPESSHIEQESMIKKYEILLQKINPNNKVQEKNNNNNDPIIDEAEEYLEFIKQTQSVSESMVQKHIKKLDEIENNESSLKLIGKFKKIQEKIDYKKSQKISYKGEYSNKENKKILLSKTSEIKVDKNVVEEIESLHKKLKQSKSKKEKTVIYKKILFYLDLISLPENKKEKILSKIKATYEGE